MRPIQARHKKDGECYILKLIGETTGLYASAIYTCADGSLDSDTLDRFIVLDPSFHFPASEILAEKTLKQDNNETSA